MLREHCGFSSGLVLETPLGAPSALCRHGGPAPSGPCPDTYDSRMGWLLAIVLLPIALAAVMAVLVVRITVAVLKLFVVVAIVFVEVVDEIVVPRRLPS
jgi:hypothetical protein